MLIRCCVGFVIDLLFCHPLSDASLSLSSSCDVARYCVIASAVVIAARAAGELLVVSA